ncbi:histidine phosphotransferase family protein [Candidatus Mesenet endosymbiont of Agriotes lineatus]|uniref:histidine phosphotransferase family protein n=1 Tax=Candidatus Mesenet endosymbiont of Agriotes lineatus TaxID=3077948 RepID=UPI0030CE4201
MDQNILLSVVELITARLFHDFASPMNGIINSVEFFESDSVEEEALSILQEGSNSLLYKFKMMRQAYSFSESNSSFEEIKNNIINYLSYKKIAIEWSIENLDVEDKSLIEKINKVIANVAILINYKIANDSAILLTVKEIGDEIVVAVKITKKGENISSVLKTALENVNNSQLDTKNINTFFLHLLLKSYNANIKCDKNDTINIVFPSTY